jgi:hypothetical protein
MYVLGTVYTTSYVMDYNDRFSERGVEQENMPFGQIECVQSHSVT